MKKEQLFYTFHDELFYQLALPKIKVKEGGASLKLTNESELLTTQELFLIMTQEFIISIKQEILLNNG